MGFTEATKGLLEAYVTAHGEFVVSVRINQAHPSSAFTLAPKETVGTIIVLTFTVCTLLA